MLMHRQHSSQQKFFDLLGELEFRAILHFAMGVMYHDFHNRFLFLTSVVMDLPWPYFFSRIFQCDILDFLSPTDISCPHAGGLFHFRNLKGQGTYSIDPADYPDKPLYAAAPDNRLLNEFFLLVLRDVHEWQSLGALQFTSDEPHFVKELIERVYPEIPSTPYAPACRRPGSFQGL